VEGNRIGSRAFLGETRGEDDGDVVQSGEAGEIVEDGARGGDGGVDGCEAIGEAEVIGDWVDDEECEIGDLLDDGVEVLEGLDFDAVDEDGGDEGVEGGEEVDVGHVGVEGFEAWAEGVGGVVFGAEEERGEGRAQGFNPWA